MHQHIVYRGRLPVQFFRFPLSETTSAEESDSEAGDAQKAGDEAA